MAIARVLRLAFLVVLGLGVYSYYLLGPDGEWETQIANVRVSIPLLLTVLGIMGAAYPLFLLSLASHVPGLGGKIRPFLDSLLGPPAPAHSGAPFASYVSAHINSTRKQVAKNALLIAVFGLGYILLASNTPASAAVARDARRAAALQLANTVQALGIDYGQHAALAQVLKDTALLTKSASSHACELHKLLSSMFRTDVTLADVLGTYRSGREELYTRHARDAQVRTWARPDALQERECLIAYLTILLVACHDQSDQGLNTAPIDTAGTILAALDRLVEGALPPSGPYTLYHNARGVWHAHLLKQLLSKRKPVASTHDLVELATIAKQAYTQASQNCQIPSVVARTNNNIVDLALDLLSNQFGLFGDRLTGRDLVQERFLVQYTTDLDALFDDLLSKVNQAKEITPTPRCEIYFTSAQLLAVAAALHSQHSQCDSCRWKDGSKLADSAVAELRAARSLTSSARLFTETRAPEFHLDTLWKMQHLRPQLEALAR